MKVCLAASSNCVIGLVNHFYCTSLPEGYTFDSKYSTPISSVCVSVVHAIQVKYVRLLWNRVIVPVPQGHLIHHLYV